MQITKLRYVDRQDINDELFALSCEPDLRVRIYSACLVNGVRFHTVDREKNRRTQNSGIMVEGTHDNQEIDFYGSLKEIIEIRYNADSSGDRTVVLFRCDWFDTHGKKFRMKEDGFFKSINHGSLWYKDDPFILATQATKVFYLLDTKYHEKWRVVQNFHIDTCGVWLKMIMRIYPMLWYCPTKTMIVKVCMFNLLKDV